MAPGRRRAPEPATLLRDTTTRTRNLAGGSWAGLLEMLSPVPRQAPIGVARAFGRPTAPIDRPFAPARAEAGDARWARIHLGPFSGLHERTPRRARTTARLGTGWPGRPLAARPLVGQLKWPDWRHRPARRPASSARRSPGRRGARLGTSSVSWKIVCPSPRLGPGQTRGAAAPKGRDGKARRASPRQATPSHATPRHETRRDETSSGRVEKRRDVAAAHASRLLLAPRFARILITPTGMRSLRMASR